MSTAPQRPVVYEGEVRTISIAFAGKLDSGELLTGTPTFVEVDSPGGSTVAESDLTFANAAINAAAKTVNGRSYAAGQVAQAKVSGQKSGRHYWIRASCGTDATPAQTLYGFAEFDCD